MDWFQSSLTGQQRSRDSGGNNFRKGYKANSKKCSDPNQSDTPLLFESPQCPDNEHANIDLSKESGELSGKKISMLQNVSSKAGFLSCSILDKGNSKVTSPTGDFTSHSTSQSPGEPENKKLLNHPENCRDAISDDDDDDDSEDEWCLPRSGGYQKVRSGAY